MSHLETEHKWFYAFCVDATYVDTGDWSNGMIGVSKTFGGSSILSSPAKTMKAHANACAFLLPKSRLAPHDFLVCICVAFMTSRYYKLLYEGKREKMGNYLIRQAEISDAKRLVEIYSYYVEETAVSFEYETPSVDEFVRRITGIKKQFPYLVYEEDGVILGYVYVSSYSKRKAYDWTVTTSIYIDKEARGRGIGRKLYEALETALKPQKIRNLMAGIAYCEEEDEYLTHDSILFHEKMGYKKVALMPEIGKKFDRWYDLVWEQKVLY